MSSPRHRYSRYVRDISCRGRRLRSMLLGISPKQLSAERMPGSHTGSWVSTYSRKKTGMGGVKGKPFEKERLEWDDNASI